MVDAVGRVVSVGVVRGGLTDGGWRVVATGGGRCDPTVGTDSSAGFDSLVGVAVGSTMAMGTGFTADGTMDTPVAMVDVVGVDLVATNVPPPINAIAPMATPATTNVFLPLRARTVRVLLHASPVWLACVGAMSMVAASDSPPLSGWSANGGAITMVAASDSSPLSGWSAIASGTVAAEDCGASA